MPGKPIWKRAHALARNASPAAPPAAETHPLAALPPRGVTGTRPARRNVVLLACVILGALVVVNVGGGGILWAMHASTASKAATTRLESHLTAIQALVTRPDLLQPATLAQLQRELTATTEALEQVQSVLPFGGAIGTGDQLAEARAVQLGLRVAEAMQGGISAFLAVRPGLIALTNSVFQGGRAALPPDGKRLTLDEVHTAQVALFGALASWRQALSLRSSLSSHDLALVSAPTFLPLMRRFDQMAPSLTYTLNTMSALIDWSPGALGLQAPEHFLLVEMDPSVLRPTGGAFARYAVLTTENGVLTSGLQLHPTAVLDCPKSTCPETGLPPVAKWFPLNSLSTRLQDANVDPDLATSAHQIEAIFERKASLQVDGMLLVTPALFANVLAAIGPVSIAPLHEELTAENVEERLNAAHQAALAGGRTTRDSSGADDLDTLLTRAIMARLATLDAPQRDAVGQAVLKAFATKDLQLFSNSPRVEEALMARGLAGQVRAPAGDSLALVDTNMSGAPINPYITETATDAVTLDTRGGAHHLLSITYRYALPTGGVPPGAAYVDVVRVVVPEGARPGEISEPCAPTPMAQAHHVVLACQLTLAPGATATLRFSWDAPHVWEAAGHAPATYALLLQRQPGADLGLRVAVSAPTGQAFASATAPGQLAGGQLTFSTAPLLADVALQARFAP